MGKANLKHLFTRPIFEAIFLITLKTPDRTWRVVQWEFFSVMEE